MGGRGAVNILYRGEIKRAEEAGEDVGAVRTRLANEYLYNVASVPRRRARRAGRDHQPAATRVAVVKALRSLRTKRASMPPKKHGNILVSEQDTGTDIAGSLRILTPGLTPRRSRR